MSQHKETNPHFIPQQHVQPQHQNRQEQQWRPKPGNQHDRRPRYQDQQPQYSRGQPQPRDEGGQQPSGPRLPPPKRTKALTWSAAAFCAIFWITIILGGLVVLIVYLVYRPRSPQFNVSSLTLNAAYLDMGYLLNADVTVLANFTNPNKKVRVDFSYMIIDLYYGDTLVATRAVEPFSAASRESMFANVHMVSSQVRLSLKDSQRLTKQMMSNRVTFDVKGLFRTRSNLGGFLRYSYWLYGHCTVVVTGPPSGVLLSTKCRTKR
ncbi:hypothetical protein L1049_006331 [Liquidambar formosana]|uniref:Late embryogenesis abundant protein LEA-2 subgroup domain-containing protein n=1 Tax=Liquidambar formosana TaxID=63359 RepID=A0AAP0RFB6_LIQFO